MAIQLTENPHFEVSTSFKNFNKVLKKAMVEIGLGVYITFTPVEKKVVDGDKIIIDKYVDCVYVDETSGYTYTFVLSLDQVTQLITLLQTIKGQLQVTSNTGGDGNTGCTRGVVIKP